MKSISILTAILLLSITTGSAQNIENAKTENVKIKGNCNMCKATIEKAGNVRKVAAVSWNGDTEMAAITYDSTKTTQDEILKRIALAGYDSDAYLAPDDVYNNLPGCCQYERNKTASKMEVKEDHSMHNHNMAAATVPKTMEDHSMHNDDMNAMAAPVEQVDPMNAISDSYFGIKDALIKSDGATAAAKAKELGNALAAIKMESLSAAQHTVWMQLKDKLQSDAKHISGTKDVTHQRDDFAKLSANMYQLIKVSKRDTPVYYQHCPMYNDGKGADWLSMEKAIKNPYYGSQMLTCGSTTETIK